MLETITINPKPKILQYCPSLMTHDVMLEKGWKSVAERIDVWLREKGL